MKLLRLGAARRAHSSPIASTMAAKLAIVVALAALACCASAQQDEPHPLSALQSGRLLTQIEAAITLNVTYSNGTLATTYIGGQQLVINLSGAMQSPAQHKKLNFIALQSHHEISYALIHYARAGPHLIIFICCANAGVTPGSINASLTNQYIAAYAPSNTGAAAAQKSGRAVHARHCALAHYTECGCSADITSYPPVELYILNKNAGLNNTGSTSFKCVPCLLQFFKTHFQRLCLAAFCHLLS